MMNNSIAVILITLNEGHNLERTFANLSGWADEIFVLDSFSTDDTVDICIKHNVTIFQHSFIGFGDQWNKALNCFPITSSWTMKLDPDEEISDELKSSIKDSISKKEKDGFYVDRYLYFMEKRLPIKQEILRVWRTGECEFTDSLVNEYPVVSGNLGKVRGELKHFDSPNLEHWYYKQNKYSTAEAISKIEGNNLALKPSLFGNEASRRMFFKNIFYLIPFRYLLLYLYHLFFLRAIIAGRVGLIWAKLRCDVYRQIEYKYLEMKNSNKPYKTLTELKGLPDNRCKQID